jgi:hypothetical protein
MGSLDDLMQRHIAHALADHPERFGGPTRKIDDASAREWPAIIDADDDGAAALLIHYADAGTTRTRVPNGRVRWAAVMPSG